MLSTIFDGISRCFSMKDSLIKKFIPGKVKRCFVLLTIIHLSLLTASYAQTNIFDFYLPWDDSTQNITNLSFLNHKPAGKLGHVTVGADGHFYVGSERIRFLGVSFTGASCFPDHTSAEKIAKRLTKFGINIVRFHFLDAPAYWNHKNIFDSARPGTRNLCSIALDRLDYFIAKLKENGIYVNINLLVGRDFQPEDGLPASINNLSWKEKQILGFFYQPMIDLQKEYATQLLDRVNPHTGIYYANEPAIAMIELVNESGLVQGWLSGTIDKLPIEFAAVLKTKWNDWLVNKYITHSDLVSAGWALSEPLGPEMLKNNDFSQGLAYWNFEQHELAKGTATVTNEGPDGQNSVKIQVTQAGTAGWHIQFNQPNLAVNSARPYTLTFYAKADRDISIYVNVGQAHDPWQILGFNELLNLTTSYQRFQFELAVSQNNNNARINFTNMGHQTATYWFSGLSFRPGGTLGLFEDENLDTKTIRLFTLNEQGQRTKIAQKDWVRFLLELESNFWLTMYNHIRNTIGMRALINATTVDLTSTPNLMAKLDYVSTHAYWNHPHFPGIPWDPSDWYVRNAPLVKDLHGGTISDIAMRRIWNRPFTVGEYDHPAPNTFAGSAHIFLSAYAAFHEWDGLFGYTYANFRTNWDARKIAGFFCLDQHPTKFLSFIPAALMFRRGDVSPANYLVAVHINKEDEVEQALITSAWRLINAQDKGMPRGASLLHKTAIITEGYPFPEGALTPAQISLPPDNNFVSDTNELAWNTAAGIFTVNTDRTKVVLGYTCNKEFNLGGVIIRPQPALQNWSTITMSLIEGENFASSPGRILITATGAVGNTNMGWKIYPDIPTTFPPPVNERITVGTDWGIAPSIVEGINSEFILPHPQDMVRVYALDNIGNRKTRLPTSNEGGNVRFQISSSYQTLWYEVVITATLSDTIAPSVPANLKNQGDTILNYRE